jgi:hypothetical protein
MKTACLILIALFVLGLEAHAQRVDPASTATIECKITAERDGIIYMACLEEGKSSDILKLDISFHRAAWPFKSAPRKRRFNYFYRIGDGIYPIDLPVTGCDPERYATLCGGIKPFDKCWQLFTDAEWQAATK